MGQPDRHAGDPKAPFAQMMMVALMMSMGVGNLALPQGVATAGLGAFFPMFVAVSGAMMWSMMAMLRAKGAIEERGIRMANTLSEPERIGELVLTSSRASRRARGDGLRRALAWLASPDDPVTLNLIDEFGKGGIPGLIEQNWGEGRARARDARPESSTLPPEARKLLAQDLETDRGDSIFVGEHDGASAPPSRPRSCSSRRRLWGWDKEEFHDEHVHERCANRVFVAVCTLGGYFIKNGQRFALMKGLPKPHYAALQPLFAEVPERSFTVMAKVFHDSTGKSITDVFEHMEPASAPLARADVQRTLRPEYHDGKSDTPRQHPAADAAVPARRLRLDEAEADQHIRELDLRNEADNLKRVGVAMERAGLMPKKLVVPQPVEALTTRKTLVMDHLQGTTLGRCAEIMGDYQRIVHTMELVAQAEGYQILLDGCVNVDPHPGNIICMDDGRVGLIDFGQCAFLGKQDRRKLAKIFVAIRDNDRDATIAGMKDLGFACKNEDGPIIERYAVWAFDRIDITPLLYDNRGGPQGRLQRARLLRDAPAVSTPEAYAAVRRVAEMLLSATPAGGKAMCPSAAPGATWPTSSCCRRTATTTTPGAAGRKFFNFFRKIADWKKRIKLLELKEKKEKEAKDPKKKHGFRFSRHGHDDDDDDKVTTDDGKDIAKLEIVDRGGAAATMRWLDASAYPAWAELLVACAPYASLTGGRYLSDDFDDASRRRGPGDDRRRAAAAPRAPWEAYAARRLPRVATPASDALLAAFYARLDRIPDSRAAFADAARAYRSSSRTRLGRRGRPVLAKAHPDEASILTIGTAALALGVGLLSLVSADVMPA
ncbi:amino acid transmembrane transporter [Aureococcus anophagefferens]|nr:amino acid transmembrane transporter [Aureococcus anophagefferens]